MENEVVKYIRLRHDKAAHSVQVQSSVTRCSRYDLPGCRAVSSGQAELLQRRRAEEMAEDAALLPGDVLPERLYQASLRLDGPHHPLFLYSSRYMIGLKLL